MSRSTACLADCKTDTLTPSHTYAHRHPHVTPLHTRSHTHKYTHMHESHTDLRASDTHVHTHSHARAYNCMHTLWWTHTHTCVQSHKHTLSCIHLHAALVETRCLRASYPEPSSRGSLCQAPEEESPAARQRQHQTQWGLKNHKRRCSRALHTTGSCFLSSLIYHHQDP